jgi:hypothetical protein
MKYFMLSLYAHTFRIGLLLHWLVFYRTKIQLVRIIEDFRKLIYGVSNIFSNNILSFGAFLGRSEVRDRRRIGAIYVVSFGRSKISLVLEVNFKLLLFKLFNLFQIFLVQPYYHTIVFPTFIVVFCHHNAYRRPQHNSWHRLYVARSSLGMVNGCR